MRQFHLLADFLAEEGNIEDLNVYKKNFPAFLSFARHFKSYQIISPFCQGRQVLDIGCFLGYGAKQIAGCAGAVIAVDRHEKALLRAARFWNDPRLRLVRAEIPALPFPDVRFDAVIAFELIEHIRPAETGVFLEEVNRVLKPGGWFFLSTPNRSFRLLPGQRPFNPEHFREFRSAEILGILKEYFPRIRLRGIKAAPWVETIERNRVRQSPLRVYLCRPLVRIVEQLFPNIRHGIAFFRGKKGEQINPDNFQALFEKFASDDFCPEDKNLSRCLTLLASCCKDRAHGLSGRRDNLFGLAPDRRGIHD